MRSLTWLGENEIKNLPPMRGAAAEADFSLNIVSGWTFLPEQTLSEVQLHLNGKPTAYVPLWERPDVAEIYPRIPHALRSGYQLKLPAGLLHRDDLNRLTVIGYHDDKPFGCRRMMAFHDDVAPKVSLPPPDIMKRTQGHADATMYKRLGYRFYRETLDAIIPHRDPSSIRKILDWGCGSGRVAANFLSDPHHYVVHACDFHADSIAWCQAHLPAGKFDVSPKQPPLPYPNSTYDLILALGVVYYFSRDELSDWLRELRRVLAHRGILVISIQGAFAAKVRCTPDAWNLLIRNGTLNLDEYDAKHPPSADEQLFRGGYYWTPECVKQTASHHFRILDYLEGAFTGDQDLLVLEKVD